MKKKVKIRTELLKQLAENNSFSEKLIKKEFPQLFENKLEVGKWYKFKPNGTIGFYKGKNLDSYGIHNGGNWIDNCKWFYNYNLEVSDLELATPQEVETALINEAKKRGYKEGNYNCLKSFYVKDCKKYYYNSEENQLRISNGYQYNIIFDNGKWAEIIETPNEIITIVEKYGKDKVISLIEKM